MHFGPSVFKMAAGGQTWSKFKDKMKELCQGKRAKKDSSKAAKELETLVVQRLSAEILSSWCARVRVLRRLRRNLH